VAGHELHERLILRLVDSMLERSEGACLTVTEAYQIFCKLAEQRGLAGIKRSMFKEMMADLVRERYGMGLRHDIPDQQNRHQQAWKGLKLMEVGVGLA